MSKHVLITGGAGFIGHHVVDYLVRNTDWKITTIDRLDFSGNLNRLSEVIEDCSPEQRKRVNIIFHDLKSEINPLLADQIGYPDTILHLAAGSHVDRSITHPLEFVMDNVVGTAHILEYARKLYNEWRLDTFVYFSTDEVFGPAHGDYCYTEWDRYNSTNPYSATKAGGEELCVAYRNTYGMPIMVTHTMNVFGERQTPEKFIPSTIRKVKNGEVVTIHSDKTCTKAGSRFYIHANDVASALHFLVKNNPDPRNGAMCPKFNIVGKQEIDNLKLAHLIATAQPGKDLHFEMVDFHSARPGHDLRYALDGDLMKSLGWEPTILFEDRIHQVSDWYLSHPKWLGI